MFYDKARADELIQRLHKYAHDDNGYEQGLPVYEAGKMALMREIIREWLEETGADNAT